MKDHTKRIFLVGMPGSGKSTVGPELAQNLGIPFFDLDDLIEAGSGMTIPEIFESEGEKEFRIRERDELKKVLEKERFVLATGGGTPCFHDGMRLMKREGLVIFLDTALKDLLKRVTSEQPKRPLLQLKPQESLKKLHTQRLPIYRQAHLIVNDPIDIHTLSAEVAMYLKKD